MAYGVDPSRLHRGGSASRSVLTLLIERAGGGPYVPCGRCPYPVDVRLSGLTPGGPTVGHVVPVGRGGTDALSNLRVEHRSCNLRAGDTMPADQPTIARVVERS